MRKNLPAAVIAVALVISPSLGQADVACLVKNLDLAEATARANYAHSNDRIDNRALNPSQAKVIASHAADRIRGVFAYFNGNTLPATVVQDGTVPRTLNLLRAEMAKPPEPVDGPPDAAESAAGADEPEVTDLLGKPADLKSEIKDMLAQVTQYGDQIDSLKLETATLSMKAEFLKAAIAQAKAVKNFGEVRIRYPEAVGLDANHEVIFSGDGITSGKTYFAPSSTAMELELSRVETEIARRTGQVALDSLPQQRADGRYYVDEITQRIVKQAVMLKRLENIRRVILTEQTNAYGGRPLPSDLQKIVDSISALYKNPPAPDAIGVGDPMRFKENISPPLWAWQSLHFNELGSEFWNFYRKTVPKFTNEVEKNQFFQFLQQMPDSEKRALRVDQLSAKAGWWAQSSWGQLVKQTVTGGSLPLAVYHFAIGGASDEENCAVKVGPKYDKCLAALAEKKFGGQLPLDDPKIATWYAQMAALHEKRGREANEAAANAAISADYGRKAAVADRNSATYRINLIADPSVPHFNQALLGTKPDGSDGYLVFKDAGLAQAHLPLITEILNQEFGSSNQKELMGQLRQSTPELAKDLQKLLDHHHDPSLGDPFPEHGHDDGDDDGG